MVVPQDSLSASGSYGKNFKEMIEKNSKFLGNINELKENSIMVISFADKSLDKTIKNLQVCMQHKDGSLLPYQ